MCDGKRHHRRVGFTLLELLVALGVLTLVMSVIGAALAATIDGWDRSRRVLDRLRRGEHVMDQLANALRSSVAGGASTRRGVYALQIANTMDDPPLGYMSWVTSSGAFLPPGSPMNHGLHRIALSIEQMDDGRPALAVRAWPYLVDDSEWIDRMEPGFLAPSVCGLSCRVYDYLGQGWQTEWTSSNTLPALVEISVYVQADDDAGPMLLQRLIEMPMGVTNVNDSMRIEMNPMASSSGNRRRNNEGDRVVEQDRLRGGLGRDKPQGGGRGDGGFTPSGGRRGGRGR